MYTIRNHKKRAIRSLPIGARPSFVEGIARLFDWGGSLQQYRYEETPASADYEAMRHDWVVTGNDMRSALAQYAGGH